MKKFRYLIPLAVFGLTLTGCSGNDLVLEYSKEDQEINTEWEDYNIPATGVTFASGEEHISIEKGETYEYSYQVTPKGATGASLVWDSSDETVAIVNDGVVTAYGGGNCVITVSEENGTFTPINLNVTVTVMIEDFDVSAPATELDWNHQYQFEYSYSPSDTTYTDLIWSIPEPEVPEDVIATVDQNGLVTTYAKTGTVTLSVRSAQLPDKVKEFELHVADREIHVSSITLSSDVTRLEIGHTGTLSAVVEPSNADDINELAYFSRDPNIATVDAKTGTITAISEGVVELFANCDGKDSNSIELEVFEVFATGIAIDKTSSYEVSNDADGSKQLLVSVSTNEEGYSMPTSGNITYESSDPEVVAVSDSGLLSGVKSGSATITAKIRGENAVLFSDAVEVTSKCYATAVTVSGPTSGYLDETVTLTATVSPDAVEDESVEWSVNPMEKVNAEINGNVITLTPNAEGPVTVTATSAHNNVSGSHTVSFSERKVEFESGMIYLVGNKQFNTGSSITGAASWTNAKYAYKFTEEVEDPDVTLVKQYKATINFEAGDEWKLREGPLDTGWKNLFTYAEDGSIIWNYEQAGAIDNVHMRAASSDSGNISVLTAGSYDIYYKYYASGDFRVYVGITPSIAFDKTNLTMGIGSGTQVKLSNYAEPVEVSVAPEGIVDVAPVSGETQLTYTVTGVAAGSAVITASDASGKSATCSVTVSEGATGVTRPIYLNAYGLFDTDGVVPFVHAYNSETTEHSNLKMTLVSGQSIVYSAEISEDYDAAIFVRMPEGSTELDWDKAYNQTRDSEAFFESNNMFTMTGYVEDTEANKTYVTGSWSVYDPSIVYTIPAPYTLVGSFNNWTGGDQNYGLTKQSEGVYVYEDFTCDGGTIIKVTDASGSNWYSNSSAPTGAPYTLVNDGYGGYNISITNAGTYDITFYSDGRTNPIAITTAGSSPVDPDPTTTAQYYVEGINGVWEMDEAYAMNADSEDANHYYLEVELAAYDEIKVYDKTNDVFIGSNEGYTEQEDYWVTTSEGNVKALVAGTFYVDLYVEHSEGNHVKLYYDTGSGGGEGGETVYEHTYYAMLKSENWAVNESNGLTLDTEDSNHYYIQLELAAEEEVKVYNPTTDSWIGSNAGYTLQEDYWTTTSDGNVKALVAGTFYVDFYVEHGEGNHVKLYYDTGSGGGQDTPTTTTLTIDCSAVKTDGAIFMIWAWSGSSDGYLYATSAGTSTGICQFEIPTASTGFIIFRMDPTTSISDYSTFPEEGKYWNKSDDVTIAGTSYIITGYDNGLLVVSQNV